MKQKPEISILVPVYKAEQLLGRCIESILNQTFTDFELILVNDGSPDKSGEICDQYAAKDNRIRVFHQKNRGASSARNTCVAAAVGNYIGWVDADDYIAENMYESQYRLAKEYDADITECQHYTISGQKIIKSGEDGEIIYGKDDFILHEFFNARMKPNLWTKLYKREIWERVRFPLGRNHQDGYVNLLFSLMNINYVRTSKAFYYYEPKENSITTTVSNSAIREAIYLHDFQKNLAKKDGISKKAKKYLNYDAVNRLLLRYYFLCYKNDIKEQYIYNKIILKRIRYGFLPYLLNKRVIWKTKVNYILLLLNLLHLKKYLNRSIIS